MSDPRALVLAEVRTVADAFVAAGHAVYLVGGVVRDLELGAALDDIDLDLTTDAHPDRIRLIVDPLAEALWAQGEKFGTIGVRVGGRPYEITTHRAEWYAHDSRKPEVVFGDDIEGDLSRRDFTVNAMAIRLPDGELIDPFDGRLDLDRRLLRTPIDADVSFTDDPLRILRAARFIARYGLQAADEVTRSARRLVDRLAIVSAERVRDELDKLLVATRPSSGLDFLDEVGALRVALGDDAPDATAMGRLLDGSPTDLTLRRTLFFHHVAADRRRSLLSDMRYSNSEQRQIRTILEGVDQLVLSSLSAGDWTDEAIRRLVDAVGIDDMTTVFAHAEARGVASVSEVRDRFDRLAGAEDLSSFEPAATGEQVMHALDLSEGPAVGAAMAALRDRRLRQGPANADEELAYLVALDPRPGA